MKTSFDELKIRLQQMRWLDYQAMRWSVRNPQVLLNATVNEKLIDSLVRKFDTLPANDFLIELLPPGVAQIDITVMVRGTVHERFTRNVFRSLTVVSIDNRDIFLSRIDRGEYSVGGPTS